jgi:hypothetical protein
MISRPANRAHYARIAVTGNADHPDRDYPMSTHGPSQPRWSPTVVAVIEVLAAAPAVLSAGAVRDPICSEYKTRVHKHPVSLQIRMQIQWRIVQTTNPATPTSFLTIEDISGNDMGNETAFVLNGGSLGSIFLSLRRSEDATAS